MKLQSVLVTVGLYLACWTASVPAATINIDVDGYNATSPTPQTYAGIAVAGGGSWNGYLAGDRVDPAKSGYLTYSDGTLSTVRFDLSFGGADNQATKSEGLNALMDDYVGARGANLVNECPTSITFALDGLTAGAEYTIYIYGNPSIFAGCQSVFTIGSTSLSTNGEAFDGAFVSGRDYVTFHQVHADGAGVITGSVAAVDANTWGILNGLQVVSVVNEVPEPTTTALLAGCLLFGIIPVHLSSRRRTGNIPLGSLVR